MFRKINITFNNAEYGVIPKNVTFHPLRITSYV